jgi:hypothetical protein
MLCRYYRHMVEYRSFDLKLALYETTATTAVAAQHSVAVRAQKNKLILHGYLRQS